MKKLYSGHEGKMLKFKIINTKRAKKGQDEFKNITEWILHNHSKSQKKKLTSLNRRYKTLVNKLHTAHHYKKKTIDKFKLFQSLKF